MKLICSKEQRAQMRRSGNGDAGTSRHRAAAERKEAGGTQGQPGGCGRAFRKSIASPSLPNPSDAAELSGSTKSQDRGTVATVPRGALEG